MNKIIKSEENTDCGERRKINKIKSTEIFTEYSLVVKTGESREGERPFQAWVQGDPMIDSLLVVSASAFIPLLLILGNTLAGCIISDSREYARLVI